MHCAMVRGGKHHRTKLRDILTLKAKIDAQQAALDALAENTETLISQSWRLSRVPPRSP
jgi:hypothetical protein